MLTYTCERCGVDINFVRAGKDSLCGECGKHTQAAAFDRSAGREARLTDIERERDEWKRRAGIFEASRDKWMRAADDADMEAREYLEALERIGDMMGKAVDDSKNLYLAVTTAKSAITRQRRKLAEAKDEVIETAKRRYDALTNKPTDALGFAVYRLREAEKEVGE